MEGRMIAFEISYPVRTQEDSTTPAERLQAMCGNATEATEVSSPSMNVAGITEAAISHGL